MGLFGKSKKTELSVQPDISTSAMMQEDDEIGTAIAEQIADSSIPDFLKFSIADVSALGSSFANFAGQLKVMAESGPFYVLANPQKGAKLREAGKDMFYGSLKKADGTVTMAKFKKLDKVPSVPVDPAQMALAALLVSIDKKLGDIQATQEKILGFLENDKKAEISSDLKMLLDVLRRYQDRYTDLDFKRTYLEKAADVRRRSDKNIDFYEREIASEIKEAPQTNVNAAVKKKTERLTELFRNYNSSLYNYAFSAFMEILLMEKNESDARRMSENIVERKQHFQKHFEESHDWLLRLSGKSVETQVAKGLGSAGVAIGKLIGATPLISKGPVDEWLQENGGKLIENSSERAAQNVSGFVDEAGECIDFFIDRLSQLSLPESENRYLVYDGQDFRLISAE